MRYETKDDCKLCNLQADYKTDPARDIYYYNCPNCGKFVITLEASTSMNSDKADEKWSSEWAPRLSFAVRKAHDKDKPLTLATGLFDSIKINETLPSVGEQADLLILWLGKNQKDAGEYCEVVPEFFRARIGASSKEGVIYILDILLRGSDYFDALIEKSRLSTSDITDYIVRLTYEGWKKYEELNREGIKTNRAFMAMQYQVDETFGISQEDWDSMFDTIKAAVEKTGFFLYRLIDKPEAGLIDDRMRVEIRNSKFTVADLTFDNRGAYWESGFAEGLGKKVIYTCEKKWFDDKRTHFDTNHLETIVWERDKLDEAAEKLKATIRHSFPADAKMTDD